MAIVLKKSRALDALNITPVIDVVFILLIFFIVAAKFAREDRELPVQLPSAQSALPLTMVPEVMTVGVSSQGGYFIDGQMLDESTLEQRIRQGMADNPLNFSVVIRGDRQVPLQHVVTVMDACREHRVPSYKLTTAASDER
jgi:biopolymer transport protein ExbD